MSSRYDELVRGVEDNSIAKLNLNKTVKEFTPGVERKLAKAFAAEELSKGKSLDEVKAKLRGILDEPCQI